MKNVLISQLCIVVLLLLFGTMASPCAGASSSARKASPPTQTPLTLLEGGDLYDPQYKGKMDVLIGGNKILGIYPTDSNRGKELVATLGAATVQVISMEGKMLLPGLVDPHMHASGGGGEMGPASRTPNAQLSQVIDAGITTLVGLLGTDSVTRTLQNLLQTLYGLEQGGLTTYMYTGSYHVPVITLTESIERDIVYLEKIIGVGEVAISDHRSNWPSYQAIVQIVSDARVAGMLSGKAGVVHFHVGAGPTMLDPLWEVVNKTTIPITQMYPTHMSNRGQRLIEEGKKWISHGGVIDFTADGPGENETTMALVEYKRAGVDLTRVTVSSDGYGSFPEYNDQGQLVGYGTMSPGNILANLRTLILDHHWTIEEAFRLATMTTADYLKLPGKGRLLVGYDADILVLNSPAERLEVEYVWGRGQALKTPQWTAHGMFPCV